MPIIRIKGFNFFKDRHGKQRCKHRASGVYIDLAKFPKGSPELALECARIKELYEKKKPLKDSFGAMMTAYKSSREFKEKRPATQKRYNAAMNFLQPFAGLPISEFDAPAIVKIREKAFEKHKRVFANDVREIFSILFQWGIQYGFCGDNPALLVKKIKRPKGLEDRNKPWFPEERLLVLTEAPPHLRLPLAVFMYTGMRKEDVIRQPRNCIVEGFIEDRTSKTDEYVYWPISEFLQEIMDQCVSHDGLMLCVTSSGTPWTKSGFDSSWYKFKKKLEAEGKIRSGLTIHGLRHTMATTIREMGKDTSWIQDALAQKTPGMALHYSKKADLRKKQRQMVAELDDYERQIREKVTNLSKKVTNLED